jgi:hypothetical protein
MGEHKFPDFAPHAVISRILQTQLVTPPRDVSLTLKKLAVAPPLLAPYLISVCSDNSFTLLNGVTRVSTVRKAAKLAVYDDTMISVKNHHTPAAVLVEIPLETKSSNGVKIERDCAHRSNFRPLLHQAPDGKPETVPDAELVDEVLGFFDARERIGPLARRESTHDEEAQRDDEISSQKQQPNGVRERGDEHEKTRRDRFGLLVQDRNAQIHELESEVDGALSFGGHRQVSDGQISFLEATSYHNLCAMKKRTPPMMAPIKPFHSLVVQL